jgi:hypothetical protein
MRIVTTGLVAGSVALMCVSHADAASKHHKKQVQQVYRSYPYPYAVQAPLPRYIRPNAAAEGNNANSMSGSNSAPENAIGRSSGGGFH